ncbi:MAG TPA: flagellar hook-basal body complex protein [Parvularculaceae bacterium]|nr:flagellar hook-basal body complex protein [Parvularculaceae bacterium]
MGLSSSLNAGVQGLAANATKLATISDNIANSATYGYKRADTEFSNMVLQQGNGTYTAGGVRVTTFKDVSAQGTLISTQNPTDISIAGRGMLPVTTTAGLSASGAERPFELIATGSFAPDQNGFLATKSGLYLMGWPANPNGTVTVPGRDSTAGLEPINVTKNQFIAAPTTTVKLGVNLPASATTAGASGAPFDLPVEYFDTLGRSQTLDLTFTPTVPASGSSNEWTVTATDSAGNPSATIATFTVTFDDAVGTGGSILNVVDGAGATYDATTGAVAINVAGGPVSLQIGKPGDGGPMTQLSSDFSPINVTKDGAPIGSLANIAIDAQGRLDAIYDNGFRRTIYQVPVADVPNMDGLTALNNQAFQLSQQSGAVFLWDAGTGPVGTTVGNTLAQSTTDIAKELTDLIQTQRAYSSSAKIIQTVDEMLQETTNLKR